MSPPGTSSASAQGTAKVQEAPQCICGAEKGPGTVSPEGDPMLWGPHRECPVTVCFSVGSDYLVPQAGIGSP